MHWQFTLPLLPLGAAACGCLIVAYLAFSRRPAPGATAFAALMLIATWWTFTYALELAGADLQTKLLCAQLKQVGLQTIPICGLALALTSLGQGHWLATRRALILVPMPVAMIALVLTNSWHGLFYATADIAMSGPFTILDVTYGPAFWLHVIYSSSMMIIAAILLAGEFARPVLLQRRQAAAAILCAIAPSIGANMRVFKLGPWPGLDYGPFALLLTSAILLWALSRQQILSLVPIAREMVIEGLRDAVFILDQHHRVVDLNPAARHLLTIPAEAAIGQTLVKLLVLPSDGVAGDDTPKELTATIALGTDEDRRDYDLTITPLRPGGHNRGSVAILREVTERVAALAKIAFLADHDSLTGLPNRRTFLARLDEALIQSNQANRDLALLFLDLDGFKLVNDTLGHASGDQLLTAVAGRLRRCLGPTDFLARLGGDEFTVLLTEHPHESAALAARIVAAIDRPFVLANGEVRVAASVGIAFAPLDGRTASTLLAAADTAMYIVKADRQDAVHHTIPRQLASIG